MKHLILSTAIYEIRKNIKVIKKQSSEISFHDLVSLLDSALHSYDKKKQLLKLIRKIYPIAIIDEFQDTDFQQYRIFDTLYSDLYKSKCGLLLIGDPKQSIYSFRGADIFSYFLARKSVNFYYTLNTNWRASESMINAINRLFQSNLSSFAPFVFNDIPFVPMNVGKNNKELRFIVQNKSYPALSFWLSSRDQLTIHEHRRIMAFQCAVTIRDLLYDAHHRRIWLQTSMKNKRTLRSSDLVILVRDRHEGHLMSAVLKKMNICNIYLSNRENVFETIEARDLLSILQAVLTPENDDILRCALITNIIGYNSEKIEFINQNENSWKKIIEEFTNYCFFWKKYGVQSMLREIIFKRGIFQNLLITEHGKTSLVNILHLAEILQKRSIQLHNKYSLIRWLEMRINSNNIDSDDQLLRLTSDYSLVKIITIHKSKGLEFPLVFIPFISNLYEGKYPLFHDRKNYRLYLDLDENLKSFDLSDQERLSEDLRLLYVAITRAIYHCFIGISVIFFKKNVKKKDHNDLHRTALGYLIQKGVPGNFKFLEKCLVQLVESAKKDIALNYINIIQNSEDHKLLSDMNVVNNNFSQKEALSVKNWEKSIDVTYTITSYTELCRFYKNSILLDQNVKLNKQINRVYKQNNVKNHLQFTPHTFPQGRKSGDVLHYIFQKLDFREKINDEWLSLQLIKYNIDLIWLPVLQEWINEVISVPLNHEKLMLSKLLSINYSTEFQFYISMNNFVSAKELNALCRKYDPISRLSLPLFFPDIQGMLHGFIDLVFFWKEKYYLLDYKSNWLGSKYNDYSESNMKHEMVVRHYALQYQIYTLALHRFLRHRLTSYNYQEHFGGIYYLFLRGINLMYPDCGIYFCRPDQILIDELDKLLSISTR